MKPKVRIEQVSPDIQDPMFDIEDWEGITLEGNRHFNAYYSELFDDVIKPLRDNFIMYYLDNIGEDRAYRNMTEWLEDYVPSQKKNGKKYSKQEIKQWKDLLDNYLFDGSSTEAICKALTLASGVKHNSRQIRGCCQSDWAVIYYPEDKYSKEAIYDFEARFFNTGTEFAIMEDDKYEFNFYTTNYREEDIIQEALDFLGYKEDEAEVELALFEYN